jgi:hypothetical protein
MIDAYLDEAGVHDDAAICVIAGFFGGPGQWKKVRAGWLRTLDKFSVPLDQFHAKEAVKRRKSFANWNDATHEAFLLELSATIVRFKVYPISFGIVISDFFLFSENERRFLTGMEVTPDLGFAGTGCPSKPYFTPFMHVIRRVASYAPVGGRAHFFFGLGRSFYGYANEMLQTLKHATPQARGYRDRIGNSCSPTAKETPELQAADYFAYLTYDRMRDCVKDGNFMRVAIKPLDMIVRHARSVDDLVFYNWQTLADFLNQLPVEVRALLA